ncbi:piggyBac transposable element-derived protein 3-like [Corticium candelabrum]|uniref:piggyBac transposable element-derived protein 3-like n=1 Tax=Corticium candelabrum TaxID=121492 RepID=UPI002E25792F|nr:piggyBac transposable element-derived protein 3-like [Corticium candelabrum]XP_062507270.1 piggyBac transposable element-derived protein 3-like [Corticium candelabrum]
MIPRRIRSKETRKPPRVQLPVSLHSATGSCGNLRSCISGAASGQRQRAEQRRQLNTQLARTVELDAENGWRMIHHPTCVWEFDQQSGSRKQFRGDKGALREGVWELVVRNTNLYALNYLDALTKEDHARPWMAVTISELTTFLGCLIYMDIQDLPRLEMYWSKKEFYLQSNIASVFTLVRFEQILRFLHVSDPYTKIQHSQEGYDKLGKVRPLIDALKKLFQAEYSLSRHIAIDEAMIPLKGQISFHQYSKSKPHKYGIKVVVLSSSHNSYIYDFNVYVGKEASDDDLVVADDDVPGLADDDGDDSNEDNDGDVPAASIGSQKRVWVMFSGGD